MSIAFKAIQFLLQHMSPPLAQLYRTTGIEFQPKYKPEEFRLGDFKRWR